MKVYFSHPRQNLVFHFLVVSTEPDQWPNHFSYFLNVDCSGANVHWVFYADHISTVKHQLYPVSQLPNWPHAFVVFDENCVSSAILVEPDQRLQLFMFMFLDHLFFQPHCHDRRLPFQLRYWKMSYRGNYVFPMTNSFSAEYFLLMNVDRSLHKLYLQICQQTHEVRFYPSRRWIIFNRYLFQLQLEIDSSLSGILFHQ